MTKALLVAATICLGVLPPALPTPLTIWFENQCSETVIVGANPPVPNAKGEIQVYPGKKGYYSIPNDFEGTFWPKICNGWTCSESENIIPIAKKDRLVGNTLIWFKNEKTMTYYHIDVDYGFSYSVKVVPSKKLSTEGVRTMCESLQFHAFDCPKEETMKDKPPTVDLTIEEDRHCNSPCVATQYDANFTPTERPDAMKEFCCADTLATCKLKDSKYLQSLRSSGSRLNSFTTNGKAIDAACNTASYTVTISCQKQDGGSARLPDQSEGQMLFYYWNKQ